MWIDKLREIHPLGVQVCTLEGEPADRQIEKVNLTTLRWIAQLVHWRATLPAEVV
jgi:hypothetical protein